MSDHTSSLRKGIGLWGVVSMGLGTAVGVSIFSAVSPATALAGPGMLLSVLIAALPMYLIAVSYAYLGSADPVSGASFVWPSRYLSPTLGFFIAWMRIIANMGAMVVLALVLVRYVSLLVPLPVKPTMFAVLVLALLANIFGVHVAARAQTLMIGALIVLFGLFAIWGGFGAAEPARLEPFLPHGIHGAIAAAPLLMGLFFGIEAATEAGSEVAESRRNIPLGIALAIGSATVLYTAVAFVALGVLGPEALAGSKAPILETAQAFMGPLAVPVIVLAAIVAIGTSLNSIFTMFSRSLFAMAEAGVLPRVLSQVHPRWHVPHMALLAVFAIGCMGLFMPMELTFLFLAVNIPNLAKYASICFCALRVARDRPDLHASASFRPARRQMMMLGGTGTLCAMGLIFVGLETDWRPYVLLLIWGVLGAVWYFARRNGREA
ncbi:APA family basic amino acid/polyamine antiporter [Novosphingobium sp. PhB165]|uniref:APC family permease n=1 Tax=Novosphingobium sp. PhB165 TaxID=2485105 RepID=UPI00104A6476|nr:amino acid permease [Novosphingobium sp. PhB165]TCM15417.1 APA family basic amino acid/polyamine antiporter [Novosphingobium sp. PhB165]